MAAPQPAAGGGGNILTQRLGPLAAWVWMLIATVVVGGLALYMRHKQASTQPPPPTQGQAQPGQVTGQQFVPDIVLQDYTNVQQTQTQQQTGPTVSQNITPPAAPPLRPPPPRAAPPPPPAPRPVAPPKPPAQRYTTVTVAKWPGVSSGGLAQWNTTLWGIANHYGVPGGYMTLAKLNGISNPNLIYPGQQIKVPVP